MHLLYRILPLLCSVLIFSGCVEYDYFGLSKEANILSFDIEGQLSNKIEPNVDWRDEGVVKITVPTTLKLSKLKVNNATCTQLSRFSIDPYKLTDFSSPVYFTVTAEDTLVKKRWRIDVTYAEASDQIPFSTMTEWSIAKTYEKVDIYYMDNKVKRYGYFPGNGESLSPWQSAAQSNAFSAAGINYFTTAPYPSASAAEFARIETIYVTSVAAGIAKAKVVTGALFTGQFLFDMAYAPVTGSNEPRKMINIGTSFYARPKSAVFKMRYKPGDVMRDGTGAEITSANANGRPTKDSCDVYVLLQNRKNDPDNFIRIAAACFRTNSSVGDINDDNAGFVEMRVLFVYGKPSLEQLAEKPYMKIGGSRGELTFYKFIPGSGGFKIDPVGEIYAPNPDLIEVDNISILFSSSAYGDSFMGAVNPVGSDRRGSTLDIKDFKLEY